MANNKIVKTILIKGEKGDDGGASENDTTIPINGLVFYDDQTLPEGYELYREL